MGAGAVLERRMATAMAPGAQILYDFATAQALNHTLWGFFAGNSDDIAPMGKLGAMIAEDILTLGIETSCDETSLALYHGGRGLLGQVVHSQSDLHGDYGGVVPELAARDHANRLMPLMKSLLEKCQRQIEDIGLIAYTRGPGLAGALMAGAGYARALAYILGRPCVGLHHMEAHLLSVNLDEAPADGAYIALLVSGGHTLVAEVAGLGSYTILGASLDDACGEAFDKTAKLLGLGYPGGPALAKLAEQGRSGAVRFSRPMAGRAGLDMSFSGLKTQVLRHMQRQVRAQASAPGQGDDLPDPDLLDEATKADIARAFEECVVDVLADRALRALEDCGRSSLVVAGGVGANRSLRRRLETELGSRGMRLYIPPVQYCTDNAAMVAYLGWRRRTQARPALEPMPEGIVAPRWPIDSLDPPPASRGAA